MTEKGAMLSKMNIEVTVWEKGTEVLLDGSFHATHQSRIATIVTLMREVGLTPTEALTSVARAFDKDFDDGLVSGESMSMVIPAHNDDEE